MRQGVIASTGAQIRRGADQAGFTVRTLLAALLTVPRGLLSRRRIAAIFAQMYFCGVKAIGVTTVVGVFTGMILALQAGIEFRKVGQAETIGIIVAATVCREMGPIITAIILTAMAGSTIAAEIGTMKVSEEIDALEVMSVDPVEMLVMPRIVGFTLMALALTVLVDIVGILGGGIVAQARLGVPFGRYFDLARQTLEGRDFLGFLPKDVYSGLVKSVVFGVLISSVACAQGLLAHGGALGVGRAVRRTVVASIMLILVVGYLMTAFFYA
ncbi:MAG: ABC transporter permease [Planctomycetes bacterium]|jgi:phospholipid/cholesterol/gamma-HCH transport system permease protein|nr:ABC transporter permease [Planctomycetota bacterium]